MSQQNAKASKPKNTTAGNKPAESGPKIWIAVVMLVLLGVAAASYLIRSNSDSPPPVVSADEESDPGLDEESSIEIDEGTDAPDAAAAPGNAAGGGALTITSDVQGAAVYLNGKRVGKTPHKATPLAPGAYEVKVVQSGYETFEKTVDVTADSHTLRADLKRATPTLRVDSNVPGASVSLDGKKRGTTPVEIAELSPGTYELVVSAAGHRTHSETVEYAGGGRDVRVELTSVTIVLDEAVEVKHTHRIRGGCEGVLRASADGIFFETDHKDAFSVSLSELDRIDFNKSKLNLKVRSGRNYNFVARNDNGGALEQFHERVGDALVQLGEGASNER